MVAKKKGNLTAKKTDRADPGITDSSIEKPSKPATKKAARPAKANAAAKSGGHHHLFSNLLLFLTLTLVLGAGAGGYYLWQLGLDSQQRLQSQLDQQSEAFSLLSARAKKETANLRIETGQHQRAQRETENALALVRSQLGRDKQSWQLAEIEYILRVANLRLLLEGDVLTAQLALKEADAGLRQMADPSLLDVREQIAKELGALSEIVVTDIEGLALKLVNIQERSRSLPLVGLRYAESDAPREDGAGQSVSKNWRQVAEQMWDDVQGLVVIRRHDKTLMPLLTPEQQWFLRQNLRLKLESARLALIDRDQQLYQASIRTAKDWVSKFFDQDAAGVGAMEAQLEQLIKISVRPKLPDISASLRKLRKHREKGGRQTPDEQASTPQLNKGMTGEQKL